MATTLADAGSALQQQLGTGADMWVDNVAQLPLDLNIGAPATRNGGICSEDSAALLRLQSMLAQQQQAQGLLASLGFAPDDLPGRGVDSSSRDRNTTLGVTGVMTLGAVPPPPPPPAQHGALGAAPPPPPPARCDGRLSGPQAVAILVSAAFDAPSL